MPNISPPKFSWIRIIGMGCKGMVCCLHSCIDQGSTFICSFLIFFSGCLSFIGTPGKNVACTRSRKKWGGEYYKSVCFFGKLAHTCVCRQTLTNGCMNRSVASIRVRLDEPTRTNELCRKTATFTYLLTGITSSLKHPSSFSLPCNVMLWVWVTYSATWKSFSLVDWHRKGPLFIGVTWKQITEHFARKRRSKTT